MEGDQKVDLMARSRSRVADEADGSHILWSGTTLRAPRVNLSPEVVDVGGCRSQAAAATRTHLEKAAAAKEEEERAKAAQRYVRKEHKYANLLSSGHGQPPAWQLLCLNPRLRW